MLLTCDVECYRNYFLIMFYSIKHDKYTYIEVFNGSDYDKAKLKKLLTHHTIITFNGNNYDIPLIYMLLDGKTTEQLKKTSDDIIHERIRSWEMLKAYKTFNIDHVDIIDVLPGHATLKIYGGRIHTKTMQDLPLDPSSIIEESQLPLMRKYCANDTRVTAELYHEVEFQIGLRKQIGDKLGIDLRSKGDSKIAESIVLDRLAQFGVDVRKKPQTNNEWYYNAPKHVKFNLPQCRELLNEYQSNVYYLDETGHVKFKFSDGKTFRKIKIGDTIYTCALGGIHSTEKAMYYSAGDNHCIEDCDVTSYYPSTIINCCCYPEHLGSEFITVYQDIVRERVNAKKSGDKAKAQALKIPINATFGKFSDRYSRFYSPFLSPKITVTGQLSLLMLIEKLEENGIKVISANTDGIVTYFHKDKSELKKKIVDAWCRVTRYDMEITSYKLIASRSVSDYIAIKTDGHVKSKGAYADLTDSYNRLRNNPRCPICFTAIREYLANGTPIEQTIRECKDIRQFVTIATANGGCRWGDQTFGKSIRFYYSSQSLDSFYYLNGKRVPLSDESVPCMELPDELPADIDYDIYIEESYRHLKELGIDADG